MRSSSAQHSLQMIKCRSLSAFSLPYEIPQCHRDFLVMRSICVAIRGVNVDEFRIAVAETYDVIVQPKERKAYTFFAESFDRSGYARGTLTPSIGLTAEVPPQRVITERGMAAMGMDMSGMKGMNMDKSKTMLVCS